MVLNIEDIKKEIVERKKTGSISRAIAHQNRIKFHAQTSITSTICQPATEFLSWVSSLIPHDKAKIFNSLFRYPLKTNEITGICFDKLSRIFEGQNPSYNYQFITSEQRDDWEYYRQDVLNIPDVWSTKGWEYFKTEINCVLIVDLPSVQDKSDKYPQPYFYFLPIDSVITYEVNRSTGIMEFIIFKQPDDKIAVIDGQYYRVFSEKNNNINELLTENPHDLGYCPAKFFWNDSINLKDEDVKESPITKQLEALDWFLFFHISKKHLDLFGSYPIYSGYEQACDFSNSENGDTCDGGFLKDKSGFYKIDSAGVLSKCPKCGDKRIAGAGTFIEVPVPSDSQHDLRNPIQMLSVDVASLDYNVKEENRLKDNIITSVVGTENEAINDQALNEKQVAANFENQNTILNRIKKGFEEAQQFIDETCCRLRYGSLFISAKVNLGTEFYSLDITELRERYKIAKENGASESELDALHYQILEAEYSNNPLQLQRMIILSELEPYSHLNREELFTLYDKGLIDEDELRLKLNFSNFVRRFERENINIIEFGVNIPFEDKINIIKDKLKDYVNESKARIG